ncbi:DUF2530 domain-containing protein [Aeromicrobium sp.]|uniref:DUF2530 domain-containing protein n=1 Tax=Aeromicrobium sp. TaxID=1871063 RepID=UPI003D6B1474
MTKGGADDRSDGGDSAVREGDGPDTIERKLGHRESARRERSARRHELGRPEVTELEIGSTTHRVAEVEPMDVDGVRTMTVGTIAWGVLAVAMLPFLGTLDKLDRTWWVWTAVAGLGLGLIGIEYCRRRRNALHMRPGRRKKG